MRLSLSTRSALEIRDRFVGAEKPKATLSLARRPEESACDVADRLPQELREVVHEHGLSVVQAFLMAGITRPSSIRHLVNAVLLGAREPGNRRTYGASSSGIEQQIDLMLMRSGSSATARTLVRQMRQQGLVILPLEPDAPMMKASMETVADHNVTVSKPTKHRLRLRAALAAGAAAIFPWLELPAPTTKSPEIDTAEGKGG